MSTGVTPVVKQVSADGRRLDRRLLVDQLSTGLAAEVEDLKSLLKALVLLCH